MRAAGVAMSVRVEDGAYSHCTLAGIDLKKGQSFELSGGSGAFEGHLRRRGADLESQGDPAV